MEENVLNDNQRISLVEMDEISLYELIRLKKNGEDQLVLAIKML
jgi:hypothetical protein